MNSLDKAVHHTGKWLLDGIEHLSSLNPTDVLPAMYDLAVIEQYVIEQRNILISDILAAFKLKYEWLESGEPVIFDDVILYYLEFDGTFSKLKSDIKKNKLSTSSLLAIHNKVVVNPEFRPLK